MDFLEKNLEDIIFETDNELLQERGLDIFGKKIRQLRIGEYGICDLITYDRDILFIGDHIKPVIQVNIYELKKGEINTRSFIQCVGYARGIQRYLTARNTKFTMKITLIGSSLEKESGFSFLPNLFCSDKEYNIVSCIDLYTYEYKFDGIHFESRSGYKLINEGF